MVQIDLNVFFADFARDITLKLSSGDKVVSALFFDGKMPIHVLAQLNKDGPKYVLVQSSDIVDLLDTETIDINGVDRTILDIDPDENGISRIDLEVTNVG